MARIKRELVTSQAAERKQRVSQADVPAYSLAAALKIPQAIADNFGGGPARPMLVAQALRTQPTSSSFRMLCGSSIAYGLTNGGYNAEIITLTPLGRRIVLPTQEGDDAMAQRQALLRPRVLGEFLGKYDRAKLPREDIALNVLLELGVPRDAAKRTFDLIVESCRSVGFLREINNVPYVDLQGTPKDPTPIDDASPVSEVAAASDKDLGEFEETIPGSQNSAKMPLIESGNKQRIFISHSKNMEIVSQIKTMLNVAEVEYEVAVEEEATAIPVPEKVLSAMRNCTAAVICVTLDSKSVLPESPAVNQNVLIEIGAAFVLYDRRVILMWDKRIPVPSNLQGLYRCEFEGNELSWTVGMKLMEAIKKLRD